MYEHAQRTYDDMKANLLAHVRAMFPVQGQKHRLELDDLAIVDDADAGDYAGQKAARLEGRSWSVPMYARLTLKDQTGRVVDRARVKLIDVPRLTNRGSYIVGGSEYMFPIQKRLRSGPYTSRGASDELRTFFNLGKGRNFHLAIHPQKGHFQLQVDTSKNIPLYPVLRALGVSDDAMVAAWGREVFVNNRVADGPEYAKALRKAADKMSYGQAQGDAVESLRATFAATAMDPDNVELLLGVKKGQVDGDVLLRAATKLLKISRDDVPEDNRESLVHNDIVDLSDFVVERFKDRQFRSRIERAIKFNIDRRDRIAQIISRDAFQRPVDSLMAESQVSRSPTQTNPLGMISDYTAVTVRGEGGIQNDNALTRGLRALDPSHLGFLDPAHTPEGSGVGTTLHMTVNTRKRGRDLVSDVLDVRSGRMVEKTPRELFSAAVAFPEYVRDGKLVPGKVRVSTRGEVRTVDARDVDYAFVNPAHLLDVNTGAIPFTNHNNGTRVMTASKMGVQAKPLADGEPPMVQVAIAGQSGTLERAVGKSFSPKSPVDGVVEKVTDDVIRISGHDVQIPNYFPLNSNNFVHARPTVAVGDRVKKDQVIADTNYTRGGELSLGRNLLVAYVPYKGINVEDGVVISESAADKMTSEHLYQQSYGFDADTVLDLKKFRAYFPAKITDAQAQTLDDQGVIKKGQRVEPGAVLVAAMRKSPMGTESQRLARVSKILAKDMRDDSLLWTKDVAGDVIDVTKRGSEIVINVRTSERMRIGDKLVGRYGNKGIVVKIVDDKDMPKDSRGRTMDLLLNPNGVASRMNLGQILETTASRVAEATGKTYVAQSFGGNAAERIAGDLKAAGVKDHETISDPVDNIDIPGVLVGRQYVYKLEHQATKKMSARGGGVGETYTSENQASRGQGVGGRAIGNMELYALLAHGALANVHEMYGVKSNFDPEAWRAIESGAPLPPMQPSYAQQKFVTLLKGMGVNVDRSADSVAVVPFLDRDVKALSNGEITDFKLLRGKDLREEKNGLFDAKKTGGVNGDRWTHVSLPEPVPNPTFERAILSLLHMKKSEFDDIMSGRKKIGALSRGPAIKFLLSRIDVKKRLAEARKQAVGKTGAELNALHKEIRFLRVLDERGIKPEEYVISKLPIVPPKFRPVYTLPDGSLNVSDLNFHYAGAMQIVDQMRKLTGAQFDEQRGKLASEMYRAVGGVMGLNDGVVERKGVKGIAKLLGGAGGPKSGYVHSNLLKRRQDVSATSVIVANPKLGLDEIGLPEAVAWKTFRPFVVKELRSMGMTPLAARKAIDDKDPQAKRALERVVENKHVILNRAPSLHKFSVMAFKPRIVPGYALEIPPLVVGGFNADFDGDTMAVHVPIGPEAEAEAAEMVPSKHLYKPGTGKLQPKIEHEYVLGMFKISRVGKVLAKRYDGIGAVLSDLNARRIAPDAGISVAGIGSTTPGRVLINEAIPKAYRDYGLVFTDKAIQQKLVQIDKGAGRQAFVKALQAFADIGRRYAYVMGSSLLLSDFQTMSKQRNDAYRLADAQADRIRMGPGSDEDKRQRIIKLYSDVGNKLQDAIDLKTNAAGKSNNVMDMMVAGARGNPTQIKQMVSSIGVMLDHRNQAMPEPVRGTYTEGLSSSEFFQHMYGNRKGMIDKSQSVKDPGALTKQVIVSAAGYRVVKPDCGTRAGIVESTSGTSALDRYAAEPVAGVVTRDQLVTTGVLSVLRSKGVKSIKVRSPLTCEVSQGVCARCYGLDEEGKPPAIGDYVGIKDTHGLTEPSTQLAMKTFHTGGVAEGKGSLTTGFDRVKQLFTMPETVRGKATLAEVAGRVESVTESPYGGSVVVVAGKKHRVQRGRRLEVKIGDLVTRGQKLTDGDIQPQDMLRLNGLRAMQTQLRDDIQRVYASGNVNISAKTIETPVRILTESVRVIDPGDHPSLVAGDYATYGQVDAWNRANAGRKPVTYSHQLPGSESLPHKTDDWTRRLAHNRIQQVLTEAPAMGSSAPLQGSGPFSSLIFEQRIKRDPWSNGGLTSG